ncbi:MAG: hypothetical protein EOL88_04005 [Bacteroidia bacterium]|nr:hypothetical protein [Bacteroidales bacterium]NCD41237.1 hypothetical protein [Bacteroidia bacterium]MDD2323573.1 hypothetical protein [Bacteroidales bacterium]MDD3011256.1 hypothetical protein [Bacteroidales bacterium]MDD3961027.1 hypothetical protein [Bacteroidales bacterium]
MKQFILCALCVPVLIFFSCGREKYSPPLLSIETITPQNAVESVSIGDAIVFTIDVQATSEVNITNLLITTTVNDAVITKLDSGMNTAGLHVTKTYYQSTRHDASWCVQVMDRERNIVRETFFVKGNPDSQYGPIEEYSGIQLAMQEKTDGHSWFSTLDGHCISRDSGSFFQSDIDILCYFKYSINNGVNTPSPTFSSPGEEASATGELYDLFYPELTEWNHRNYTKWDISASNGITAQKYLACHNDSLLIHSYNDAMGKKKYKWVKPGLYIPIQTARGQHGIVHIISADTVPRGIITFDLKIQRNEGE